MFINSFDCWIVSYIHGSPETVLAIMIVCMQHIISSQRICLWSVSRFEKSLSIYGE